MRCAAALRWRARAAAARRTRRSGRCASRRAAWFRSGSRGRSAWRAAWRARRRRRCRRCCGRRRDAPERADGHRHAAEEGRQALAVFRVDAAGGAVGRSVLGERAAVERGHGALDAGAPVRALEQHQEIVAAHVAEKIPRRLAGGGQHRGRHLQHLVALPVAVLVIEGLEVVQVHVAGDELGPGFQQPFDMQVERDVARALAIAPRAFPSRQVLPTVSAPDNRAAEREGTCEAVRGNGVTDRKAARALAQCPAPRARWLRRGPARPRCGCPQ